MHGCPGPASWMGPAHRAAPESHGYRWSAAPHQTPHRQTLPVPSALPCARIKYPAISVWRVANGSVSHPPPAWSVINPARSPAPTGRDRPVAAAVAMPALPERAAPEHRPASEPPEPCSNAAACLPHSRSNRSAGPDHTQPPSHLRASLCARQRMTAITTTAQPATTTDAENEMPSMRP